MTSIPSPSVFITTSREAINKFFFGDTKVSSLTNLFSKLTEEERENSIICSPSRNTGLIEFELTGGGDDGHELRLKFLETSESFEQYFADKSIAASFLKKVFYGIFKDKSLSDVSKKELESTLFEPTSETTGIFNSRIYVSFGFGDNINTWSNPMMFILLRSRLTFDQNGNKIIEMIFQPDNNYLNSNKLEISNENKLERTYNKYETLLNNNKLIKYEVFESISSITDFSDKYFTDFCESLVRNYIRGITGSDNVIVILPNVKKVFDVVATLGQFQLQNRNIGIEYFFKELFGWEVRISKDQSKELAKGTLPSPDLNTEKSDDVGSREIVIRIDNSTESERLLPDFYEPLRRISDALLDTTKSDTSSRIILRQDTDLRLLRLWKKYGIINNDDAPVYIFAPEDVIDNIIYLDSVNSVNDAITSVFNSFKGIENYPTLIGSKFIDTSYRLEYFTTFIKFSVGSSFGENPLTDELALSEDISNLIELAGLPVFTHNTRNSNVIDLTVNTKDLPTSIYNFGIRKAIRPHIVNLFDSEFKELAYSNPLDHYSVQKIAVQILSNSVWRDRLREFKKFEDVLAFVRSKYYPPDEGYVSPPEIEKLISSTSSIISNGSFNTYTLYLSILLSENLTIDKPWVEIDSDAEETLVQQGILNHIKSTSQEIDIRTLPFVKMSNMRTIAAKCYLVSLKNRIIGSQQRTNSTQPFSGMFSIQKFKHYISTSEFYSEFSLLRGEKLADVQGIIEEQTIQEVVAKFKPSVSAEKPEEKTSKSKLPVTEGEKAFLKKAGDFFDGIFGLKPKGSN